jgi:hypothetical protein
MPDEQKLRSIREQPRDAEELTPDEAEQAQGGFTIKKTTDQAGPVFFKNASLDDPGTTTSA